MFSNQRSSLFKNFIIATLALSFVLFIRGAVPFVGAPDSIQAFWTTGFSLSFIKNPFSIYAKNFGIPLPAAMSFGLDGGLISALFLKLGLSPPDAYSAMVAFWISFGFIFAYRLARYFQVKPLLAIFGAVLWTTMNIVRSHDGYSMLGLGMGLLPFYFYTALKLFLPQESIFSKSVILNYLMYILAVEIAVFMDGYTFMMFALGSTFIGIYLYIVNPSFRKSLLFISFPIHILSFGLAYYLYTFYVGVTEYETSPISMFRGWGLDLTFAVIPTQKIFWVFDALKLSVNRSDLIYFGDSSVWQSSFILPILIAGIWSWYRIHSSIKLATCLLLLAALSFYMAMGPSIKIHSIKNPQIQAISETFMPAKAALAPTGNKWIYKTLPGFKSMRATYRWLALCVFALWSLFMLFVVKIQTQDNLTVWFILITLIILNFPPMDKQWHEYRANRQFFFKIDTDLVSSLENAVKPGETVAFLPFRNDILINYLAPKLNIFTYNIGGDKNLIEAQKKWPEPLHKFILFHLEKDSEKDIKNLLLETKTNVVIIPFFNTYKAINPHFWPCEPEELVNHSKEWCAANNGQEFADLIKELQKKSYYQLYTTNDFASIRLIPKYATPEGKNSIK